MKEKDKAKRRKRKLEGHQAGTHICTLYLDTCMVQSSAPNPPRQRFIHLSPLPNSKSQIKPSAKFCTNLHLQVKVCVHAMSWYILCFT